MAFLESYGSTVRCILQISISRIQAIVLRSRSLNGNKKLIKNEYILVVYPISFLCCMIITQTNCADFALKRPNIGHLQGVDGLCLALGCGSSFNPISDHADYTLYLLRANQPNLLAFVRMSIRLPACIVFNL